MQSSRARLSLFGAVSAIAIAVLAIPAIGQEAPESLLPPGFGEPAQTGPEQPVPEPAVQPPNGTIQPLPILPDDLAAAEGDEETPEEEEAKVDPYDLPDAARRSPDFVGVLTDKTNGLGLDAWGGADGHYLSILMRELDAPIASRWNEILLRRALLTQTEAPAGINGADWVAERAWLLLRMGEADPARMLVQGVDVDRFTPKLFDIAMQTTLATGDPAGLCPLTGPVAGVSDLASWDLARAMCAALAGEPGTAGALIDGTRRRGRVRGIDLLLAEKVVGAGVNGRRAINIQWDGVDQLTAWRFGLATTTGVTIPESLFATVGPHVRAWQARAPMLPLEERPGPASWAATLGVFSSDAYVDLYGALFDATDSSEIQGTTAETLRNAYTARTESGRIDALRTLWSEPQGARERYARLILTARAAARINPSADHADDARNLIAAMLTAGLDRRAAQWAPIVADTDDDADDAWALLAVGAPRRVVDLRASRIDDYGDALGAEGRLKAQFLIAALAGLGRISAQDAQSLAGDYGLPLGARNRWTDAIDRAGRERQPATVALLAATGMQTREWSAVPPAFLYHIVLALRRVGHEPEARMIAAEALTRL